MIQTDSEIITRCQRGDKAAFREVVENYQRLVFSLSLKMLADEEEAKDVVQDTFIRVWQSIRSYDPQKPFRTWLYTIATRLCLDRLKREKPLTPLPEDERTLHRFASDDSQRQLENAEWAAIVRLIAEGLSEKQRIAFTLCQLEGLSLREAEEITDMDARQLKSNLYVARQAIRKRLKDLGYEEYGSKYGGISFNVKFDLRQRVRMIALDESDGYAYAVILVWEQRIIPDEQTGNHWMMNGKVYEVWCKKKDGTPFVQPLAPISYYPERLTNEQYNTLIGIINPFVDEAKGQRHKDMFAYTCYTLYKKSAYYQEEAKTEVSTMRQQERPAMIQSSTATVAQARKFVSYNTLIVNQSPDLQLVECQISGMAPKDADSVTLRRLVVHEDMGNYPVRDGHFSFTCQLPKDEVCYLTTDQQNTTYFWVDGHPVNIDLPHRSAKGSKASVRRNDFVNRAETERLRMLSLKDKKELAEATQKRIQRFRQAIFSGKDSLLATYALFRNYTELTYDELKPFLRPDYRYANHPLLSPVREYAAGLEKRRPDTRYTDILLADTLGEYHHLKEYIGQGYVVLHFWESWHRGEYDILPQLRTLYDQYHAAKGLQIVSLSTDGMDNGQRWKERVRNERLPWPQLTTKAAGVYGISSWPETVVIDRRGIIIASPQTIEELSETLRKIAE